jgi:putative DNA primase/helicase
MAEESLENTIGVTFTSSEEVMAIKATAGKPSRIFPFLIRDFSLYGWFSTDLYYYTGKCYEEFDDRSIKRLIRKFYLDNELADKWTISKSRELVEMIKTEPKISVDVFDDYSNLTNLNNGVFNFDDKSIVPHSNEFKFTYFLNIDYDKTKNECPVFTKFLQGCFATKGNWEEGYEYDEDAYENILRMCGYLLYPKNMIEGLFILLGNGSNGKSVLMDVLQLFFPPKYVTGLSLNTISNEDGFQREKLIKSKINFCAEQKGGKINSEELKKVASGQGISVQRKFNQAMDFISHTKILVNCNNMPYFNDTTHAIIRRLFIFNFKNQFLTDAEWLETNDHEARRFFKQADKEWLYEEIKKEKEAIFNLFLGGLDRLRADKWHFTKSQNMVDILNEYKEGSDTLSSWIDDHFELGTEWDFVSIPEMYNNFKFWYEENFSKKCTYSSIALSKKVKEKYRIEPVRSYQLENGEKVKMTGFTLVKRKEAFDYEDLLDVKFEETGQQARQTNLNV